MIWGTAILLGFMGSLHCAGMCGPLLMALPGLGRNASEPAGLSPWLRRLVYHAGRITTYALLGVVFGTVGQTATWAGWQRWVSLTAGAAIILGLLLSTRFALGLPVARFVSFLKPRFGALLNRGSGSAVFGMGLMNGLLPCGLVYVAGAGAMATGHLALGMLFMVVFGLGTTPMMLSIGWLSARVQHLLRLRLRRLVPISLMGMASLLILRGLALGIPYVSPGALDQEGACQACASLPQETHEETHPSHP